MIKELKYVDYCEIDQSFQKSKRIDTDVQLDSLNGYHINESGWQVIKTVVENIHNSKQRAFTITGPYGSGKSSLAILMASLLSHDKQLRSKANSILGKERSDYFYKCIPESRQPWLIISVVGGPTDIVEAIWSALEIKSDSMWNTNDSIRNSLNSSPRILSNLIDILKRIANRQKIANSGMILLIDEMGKFLEFAANNSGDLFPLQEIAETFARINDNCLMLGFLHQAFGDYGRRVNNHLQSEWTKIQGRFVDVPFSMGLDEVVSLISAAIKCDLKFDQRYNRMCKAIAQAYRTTNSEFLSAALFKALPLHPVTTLLLGPISRRRFGQNERSVFSFLSSYEPAGFIEFLQRETPRSGSLYMPSNLWDYLQVNHEPSILASPDGQRWAEAAEAVLRATNRNGSTQDHINITKTIGLLDIFGRKHGLIASETLLELCFPLEYTNHLNSKSRKTITIENLLSDVLADLRNWSVAIPRRHAGGWGLFAGSDIDVDSELTKILEKIASDHNAILATLRDLSPIVAKRHYAETGTLRLFERKILKESDIDGYLQSNDNGIGPSGAFILTIPDSSVGVEQSVLSMVNLPKNRPVFLARISLKSKLIEIAIEVAALERLPSIVPQLHGDPVARREVNARLLSARSILSSAIRDEFNNASWESAIIKKKVANIGGLSILASEISNKIYHSTPKIHNELINKSLPSPTAGAARRKLMCAMINNTNLARLGIQGEPAELGLYLSLLRQTELHINKGAKAGYEIIEPVASSTLAPAWTAASELLNRSEEGLSFATLYKLWRDAPFGMREGVMPIFALAFYMANKSNCALYIDQNYIPEITDFVIDRLLTNPNDIMIRQIIGGEDWKKHLHLFNVLFKEKKLSQSILNTPLDVTKPLVQLALRLSPWAKRTKTLSKYTVRIRDALLNANDPYELLFIDIPNACGHVVSRSNGIASFDASTVIPYLSRCCDELVSATPNLIKSFKYEILKNLIADKPNTKSIKDLARRAKILSKHTHETRLQRFIQAIACCDENGTWTEEICSLASGRSIKDWTDGDIDRCSYEITQFCEKFKGSEARFMAEATGGEELNSAVINIRKQLKLGGLDHIQQRAALLLALESLSKEPL